jgi:predicted histidine transporter YuiF (NhaC family)
MLISINVSERISDPIILDRKEIGEKITLGLATCYLFLEIGSMDPMQ